MSRCSKRRAEQPAGQKQSCSVDWCRNRHLGGPQVNGDNLMCCQSWSEYPSAMDTDVTASPKFFMVWMGSKERERQSHSLMAWS